MTKEEIQKSSQKKVQAVNTLCQQLHLIPSAKQVVTQDGFIENVVFYTDVEKYDVDKEPKLPKTEEESKLAEEPKQNA